MGLGFDVMGCCVETLGSWERILEGGGVAVGRAGVGDGVCLGVIGAFVEPFRAAGGISMGCAAAATGGAVFFGRPRLGAISNIGLGIGLGIIEEIRNP
jgi:hypothetical protein